METLVGILTNIFSSFVYDKMVFWKDKKSIEKFRNELIAWAVDFEKKNDGTIITSGVFYTYITTRKIIINVFEYVANPSEKTINEQDFINEHTQKLIHAIPEKHTFKLCDEQLVKEFFSSLVDKSKKFIFDSIQPNDRAMFYCMMQTNLNMQTILEYVSYTSFEIANMKKELQKIHYALHNDTTLSLSEQWFLEQNQIQIKNLGDRYIPELNVAVSTSKVFDGIAKNKDYIDRLKTNSDSFINRFNLTKVVDLQSLVSELKSIVINYSLDSSQNLELDAIYKLLKKSEELLKKTLSDKKLNNHQASRIDAALRGIEDYLEYLNSGEVQAANKPFLLIGGEGGIGKSHILADAVSNRNKQKLKSILLLGQHFKGVVPPLQEIMNIIGVDATPDAFFEYLNNMAQMQNGRIVFFIDALNEGNGKNIWRDSLGGLIEFFKKYHWLGLVMSIRKEYVSYIFDGHVDLQKSLVMVTHTGFSSNQYEATQKYFDFYGILYSVIPLANPEFRNPLFLRLLCEGYRNQRIDLNNLQYSDIYSHYLEKINRRISEVCGYNYRYPVVLEVLNAIAKFRYDKNNHNNYISIENIASIVLTIQSKYQCTSDLLEQLLSEGVLTQNINYDGQEYLYITYEKFEDYLYSNYLVEEFASGSIEEFLEKHKKIAYNRSILECMSILISEKTKSDIFEVFSPDLHNVKYAFVESLKWRTGSSITDKTFDYLNDYILKDENEIYHLFDTLILIATKEQYPLNGYRTVQFIVNFSLPERDAFFIPLFNNLYSDESSSIHRLLDWSLYLNRANILTGESTKLSSLVIAAFLLSSNLPLRDKATKALSSLLKGQISILIEVMEFYKTIDDPYINERIYAAAFACAVSELYDSKLLELAKYVYKTIFDQETVYPNILLRDYAKNILDYAVYRLGGIEDIDLTKISPPYNSQFPPIPSDEEINKYKYDYNDPDFKKIYWSQNAILSSMKVEYSRDGSPGGYGDFGRYIFQRYFSDWTQLEPNDLRNIAIKKIFDLGYKIDLHGSFDQHIPSGRGADGICERIGKKYQWIALYELAAQVADNYPMQIHIDDTGGKAKAYCMGSFEPNIRNIDPTISLPRIDDKLKSRTIHQNIYTLPDSDHYSWLANFSDFPPFENLHRIDFNGRQFILLNGWYSWTEEKALGDKRYQNPRKDMWVNINCYITKRDQIKSYIETLSDKDFMGRWMSEPHENYHLYNKEYYWSEAFKFYQNPYYGGSEWVEVDKYHGDYSNVLDKVLVPTFQYTSERSGDSFGEDRPSWYKPCNELFDFLKLRYGKEDSVLYDNAGRVICFDSIEVFNENIGFFIDREIFDDFLYQKKYAAFWTLLAEKRILYDSTSHSKNNFPMPHISGLYYYANDKVIGEFKQYTY